MVFSAVPEKKNKKTLHTLLFFYDEAQWMLRAMLANRMPNECHVTFRKRVATARGLITWYVRRVVIGCRMARSVSCSPSHGEMD